MNKQTLIWTLVVAVPVGVAALAAGYVYKETGSLPFQSSEETTADATASAVDSPQQVAETAAKPGDDEKQQQSDAGDQDGTKTASDGKGKGLSFDVVGVEPTGETVVAGRSEAGVIVALTANGKVVGKGIANEAGEWTIILDEPLKPGNYDVGLEVHDDKGALIEQSDQRLAVSVPEDGRGQPLVVLNTPDGPSNVLQKPDAEQQLASAGEGNAAKDVQTASAPPETGDGAAGAGDTATAAASTEGGSNTQTETDAAAQLRGGSVAAVNGDQPDTADESASAGLQMQTQSQSSAPTVTVEAVESEKDKVYVAGTGEPGASVRVYVGEEYQGEARVNSSGKWLVEGTRNVPEGNVEVRADLIAGDDDSVDARAAVTFAKQEDQQIVLTKVAASGTSAGAGSQGADVQKSLPVVIIRQGDNLWRISRRLYGDGVRYTTIYQANKDQIRDPDLIYPGQVFLTPEGDLGWPADPENDESRG